MSSNANTFTPKMNVGGATPFVPNVNAQAFKPTVSVGAAPFKPSAPPASGGMNTTAGTFNPSAGTFKPGGNSF